MLTEEPVNLSNSSRLEASSESVCEVLITDEDLLAQLAPLKASPVKTLLEKRLLRVQAERNEQRQKRSAMTAVERRRANAKEVISTEALERADIHHIHSVLALCGLPYRRPSEDVLRYSRHYGRLSLTLHAGDLADPGTGQMLQQGLPYGPKARLLMLHICTRALRQKSPVIEIEDSMSAFIRSLGFEVRGGPRGTIRSFKEQLNRLSACSMQIGCFAGNRAKTINTHPISSIDVWLPSDPDQKMLWNSSVTLSRDFYDSLTEHALPVDIRALSALSQSARQMDFLLWLSYRVQGLHKPYFLTWTVLKEQFCQSEKHRMTDFLREIKRDIKNIEEVFDKKLPLKLSDKGLQLFPCDPTSLFVPPKKSVNLFKSSLR
jgi:hypothetical protein